MSAEHWKYYDVIREIKELLVFKAKLSWRDRGSYIHIYLCIADLWLIFALTEYVGSWDEKFFFWSKHFSYMKVYISTKLANNALCAICSHLPFIFAHDARLTFVRCWDFLEDVQAAIVVTKKTGFICPKLDVYQYRGIWVRGKCFLKMLKLLDSCLCKVQWFGHYHRKSPRPV